jgi:hypothetical protein
MVALGSPKTVKFTPLFGVKFRVDTSSARWSWPSIGKSRKVPAGNGPPLNVSR